MSKRLSRYLGEVQEFDATIEQLNELFIKAAELNTMSKGRTRDMQMLRLATIAEYDAANLYEMMADLASIPKLRELFLEIANEEKVHIGEFEFALEYIDPEHEHFQEEGEDEAEELTGWEEDKGEEGEDEAEELTGWEEDKGEEDVKESITEDAKKEKIKSMRKGNEMRCKAVAEEIIKRREGIKALLLQGRQWGCNE